MQQSRKILKKILLTGVFLTGMYMLGTGIGRMTVERGKTVMQMSQAEDWGLGFGEAGSKPTGKTSAAKLKENDAYYVGSDSEKVLYLTFDAGFENGNTEAILDALKKHNVTAAFFLVGNYLTTEPELVKRMVAEGHTVGNHTCHHKDMTTLSEEEFKTELVEFETMYQKLTGKEMQKCYRPPQGRYNETTLQRAKALGYKTYFWSLAYVDWMEDKQPAKEEAFDKLLGRIHPGAIVLLHSTSKTNGEIMDELLTKWEQLGYQIKPLTELK